MKKRYLIPMIAIAVLLTALLVLCFIYADNTTLQLTTYRITNEKIPAQFDGFRIVMVSDLHNAQFGDDNTDLVTMISDSDPDIIVMTGDQLDARNTNKEVVINFARQIVEIAPCYLVTGNHEGSIPGAIQFQTQLEDLGVTVLYDEITELNIDGAVIDLVGLNDPTRNDRTDLYGAKVALEMSLQELDLNDDRYSILLAHRPEYFYVYERNGIDLALCGHNHGGQIRIGDVGLISAGKELFPEYDAGVYTLDEATMVLSRGLGNSIFPWRINNPPEVVVVELNTQA